MMVRTTRKTVIQTPMLMSVRQNWIVMPAAVNSKGKTVSQPIA
jgi:hypothetical protein